jgi:hypothetical protein
VEMSLKKLASGREQPLQIAAEKRRTKTIQGFGLFLVGQPFDGLGGSTDTAQPTTLRPASG